MPTFHDPRLQKAFATAAPHLEGYPAKLDAISQDIKILERELNEKAVQTVVHHQFQTSGLESEDVQASGFVLGGEDCTEEAENLVLGRVGTRWRILYKRTRAYGFFHIDGIHPITWYRTDFLESRPLIETKADVRMRAHKALPDFLAAVARSLGAEQSDLEPLATDPRSDGTTRLPAGQNDTNPPVKVEGFAEGSPAKRLTPAVDDDIPF